MSVHLFPLYLLNQLTFDLVFFCMCMGHDHSSHEIDNQGHRSLSKVRIRVTKEDNVVSLSSSLDPGQFS